MTAVTIRPTFKKDSRPSNGLESIAEDLLKNQFDTHYVVGIVRLAGGSLPAPGEGIVPAVEFLGIEPLSDTAADGAKALLDAARKARGLGRIEDEIPAQDVPLFGFDDEGKVTIPADGERVVPEASGEEIMAERAEAKAAKVKPTTEPFKTDGAE
jgi:hypothetical protein